MTEGVCHFKIEGPWLTQFCRTLWADEDSMHKALNILDCLVGDSEGQEMTEEIALRILTGKAKLTGNSTDGIYLKEDNTDVSEHGNALSLKARIGHLSFKAQESDFEIRCRNQIKAGLTKFMASPWGGVHVPHCAWEKIKTGEWDWEELRPYVHGGDFPRTDRALSAMRSIYNYKDGEDIEYACGEIRERKEAEEAASEVYPDDAGLDFIADVELSTLVTARANVSSLPFSKDVLDKYVEDQLEMDRAKDEPPKPWNPMAGYRSPNVMPDNGWIAPNGDFFTCGMLQHDALADRLGSSTKVLEKTHVRVSTNPMSGYRSPLQFEGRGLTQNQKDKIWDWCEYHKVDVPSWVFGDEGTKFSKEEADGEEEET